MEVLNLSKVKILIDTSKFWLEIWFLPRTLFSIDLQINIFTVHISLTVLGFGFEFIFTRECLFRCSVCHKEFDYMPIDGFHVVRDYIPDIGDIDGECGPVYRV